MNKFESNFLKSHGLPPDYYLIGCDEAGRGAWAGPLVVASVILPNEFYNPLIQDSKILTAAQRKQLAHEIKNEALQYCIEIVSVQQVDKLNPKRASIFAMEKNLRILKHNSHEKVCGFIDAEQVIVEFTTYSIIKGDALSQSIAAASILAKETRDQIMNDWHKIYPQYGFNKHKGYGTKQHQMALQKYFTCPLHRKSYKPIKTLGQTNLNLCF